MNLACRSRVTCFVLVLFSLACYGQESSEKRPEWGISFLASNRFKADRNVDRAIDGYGVQLHYRSKSSFGFTAQLSYRDWTTIFLETQYLPLQAGIAQDILVTNNIRSYLYLIGGPSGIVGRDYAGIFMGAELGARTIINTSWKKLSVGLCLGQGMVFHPSDFEYLEISTGIIF